MKILSAVLLLSTAFAASNSDKASTAAVSSSNASSVSMTKEGIIEQLTQGMKNIDRANVIAAVADVDPAKYAEFIETCKVFITPDMNVNDRADVIAAVANILPPIK